ncbi:MAG: glycosyltransferase family 4 protein [Oscillatoria sp. SIO1A7]|nr:glycosyltransferase family 4 protein [Oscillatoria sp. SIO1A7]
MKERFQLPWTHELHKAASARCVLILTSEIDAETCKELSAVNCIIVLFSGIYAQKFTAVTPDINALLTEERMVCEWMDFGLVPSKYAKKLLMNAYGNHLEPKLRVMGLPIDIDIFTNASSESRDMKQILLGQRQDYDKNFILEAEICSELLARGYRVIRASSRSNPALQDFALYAERHLGVPSRGEPDKYLSQCLQSGFVLITSPAETLCITAIEAVAAGCIPVVPDHSAFQEWCHASNRYQPYSIADILRVIREAPVNKHQIARYHPDQFIESLQAMIRDGLSWTQTRQRFIPSHS